MPSFFSSCSVVNRKRLFTNLRSSHFNVWIVIGVFNILFMFMRFITLAESKGDFFKADDLPPIFIAFDAAALALISTVGFSFHQDLTKLRLWLKFAAIIFSLEALVTGIAGIFIINKNQNESAQAYYGITIASTIFNGLFFFFLCWRSWYVGFAHVYLSYVPGTTVRSAPTENIGDAGNNAENNDNNIVNDNVREINWRNTTFFADRVQRIRDDLIEYAVLPWRMDEQNELSKSLVHGMVNAKTVILFLTEEYCHKIAKGSPIDTCSVEFQLAVALSKKCLIVKLDKWSQERKLSQWRDENPKMPAAFLSMIQNQLHTTFCPVEEENVVAAAPVGTNDNRAANPVYNPMPGNNAQLIQPGDNPEPAPRNDNPEPAPRNDNPVPFEVALSARDQKSKRWAKDIKALANAIHTHGFSAPSPVLIYDAGIEV